MKIICRLGSDWFAIPCSGEEPCQWLCDEALRRAVKRHPEYAKNFVVVELRKTRGGAVLDGEDPIQSVLEDEEHVSVG